jgi:hypothetical protein
MKKVTRVHDTQLDFKLSMRYDMKEFMQLRGDIPGAPKAHSFLMRQDEEGPRKRRARETMDLTGGLQQPATARVKREEASDNTVQHAVVKSETEVIILT